MNQQRLKLYHHRREKILNLLFHVEYNTHSKYTLSARTIEFRNIGRIPLVVQFIIVVYTQGRYHWGYRPRDTGERLVEVSYALVRVN